MKKIKPWNLLRIKSFSVGKWFPIEERTYKLPNGKLIDDFTVTTLPDVSLIVPFMKDGTIAMCQQFKPGAGEITFEFPGGRREPEHKNFEETARAELKEETGITATEFHHFGETITFPTKASERVHNFYVLDAEVTADTTFDETEDIALVFFTPKEIDEMIKEETINTSPSMSAWLQLKIKYPELLSQ